VRDLRLNEIISKCGSVSEAYKNQDARKLIYVSQDNGVLSGVDLVARIIKIYRNYGYKTQVIASSIRNARQVREVAEVGADITTLPFEVILRWLGITKRWEECRTSFLM